MLISFVVYGLHYTVCTKNGPFGICDPFTINFTAVTIPLTENKSTISLNHTFPLILFINREYVQRYGLNFTDLHTELWIVGKMYDLLYYLWTHQYNTHGTWAFELICRNTDNLKCNFMIYANGTTAIKGDRQYHSISRSANISMTHLNSNIQRREKNTFSAFLTLILMIIENNITTLYQKWSPVCSQYEKNGTYEHSFIYNATAKRLECTFNTTTPLMYLIKIQQEDHLSISSIDLSSNTFVVYLSVLYSEDHVSASCDVDSPTGWRTELILNTMMLKSYTESSTTQSMENTFGSLMNIENHTHSTHNGTVASIVVMLTIVCGVSILIILKKRFKLKYSNHVSYEEHIYENVL